MTAYSTGGTPVSALRVQMRLQEWGTGVPCAALVDTVLRDSPETEPFSEQFTALDEPLLDLDPLFKATPTIVGEAFIFYL